MATNNQNPDQSNAKQEQRPNEPGQIHVEDFLKIYDPDTKNVVMEKRG